MEFALALRDALGLPGAGALMPPGMLNAAASPAEPQFAAQFNAVLESVDQMAQAHV